ncbi:MAG: GcrA cell cycle regulator [Acetobacteraceae bacterium]|nr:GcrA cell cycle regulator [Acetobacteraceae bacterium]
MEWTEEIITQLKGLWAEGFSTAEIGRRLGISKNAVVGKAHRLSLPSRPSPIRKGGSEGGPRRKRSPRRVSGPTLPPLACTRTPVSECTISQTVSRAPAPPPRPVIAPRSYGRVINCCWPIGEPGTKSFRFCDANSVPGKPYCPEHAQLAYVRIRDKDEDVA